jgi:hypothetical protein
MMVLGPGRFLKVKVLGSQGSWKPRFLKAEDLGRDEIDFAEGFDWSING